MYIKTVHLLLVFKKIKWESALRSCSILQTEEDICHTSLNLQSRDVKCLCGLALNLVLKDLISLIQCIKHPGSSDVEASMSRTKFIIPLISLTIHSVLAMPFVILLLSNLQPRGTLPETLLVKKSRIYNCIPYVTVISFLLEVSVMCLD